MSACIFDLNLIVFGFIFNITISISYNGCQISMLTFGIEDCIAFTSTLSKLHCFIVSRDSRSHLYMFALLMMIYCWSIIRFAHALNQVAAALLALPSWLTFR